MLCPDPTLTLTPPGIPAWQQGGPAEVCRGRGPAPRRPRGRSRGFLGLSSCCVPRARDGWGGCGGPAAAVGASLICSQSCFQNTGHSRQRSGQRVCPPPAAVCELGGLGRPTREDHGDGAPTSCSLPTTNLPAAGASRPLLGQDCSPTGRPAHLPAQMWARG